MPFIRRISLITLLAAIAAGCGGGGGSASPTSPTAATPAPTTPAPPPAATTPGVTPVGPYTFDFGAGTSVSDQQIIRDGVYTAHTLLQTLFGRTIAQATTITGALSAQGCAQGGAAAFTGPRSITFCMGNPGWTMPGPINRQKIAIHETFHVCSLRCAGWAGRRAVPLTG